MRSYRYVTDSDTLAHHCQHNRRYIAGLSFPAIRRRRLARPGQLQSPLFYSHTPHDDDDDAHRSHV